MTDAPVRRRDEGSALPLVLVLMVLGALIVIPMLSYTVTVLRANTVVVDANREREAAEANVRIALLDPMALFAECDGSTVDLIADEVLADPKLAGTTRCDVAEEVSALNALGFQTPNGVTATQLGATAPASLTGTRTEAPAGNTAEDWWVAGARSSATTDTIWLPDLPTFPSTTTRTATPYSMPTTFGCKVFLPGHYNTALTINPTTMGTSRVYFASGVYYFDQPVAISGEIDVIAGYGTEAFDGSECADDLQVSGNLMSGPASFGIDGVGATFVFGGSGRLTVTNGATGTGPSVRFNQRYGDIAGGGRISIMSVNGVNGDLNQAQLFVDDVVAVPRSNVAQGGTSVAIGTNGQAYQPSHKDLTSAAKVPTAPTVVSSAVYSVTTTPPRRNGVLFVWQDVTGAAANGAVVTSYAVTVNNSTTNVCPAASIVAGPDAGQLSCFVSGLNSTGTVRLNLTATNSAGTSATTQQTVSLATTSAPLPAVPSVIDPTTIVVDAFRDALRIDWPAAAHNGSVVTGYDVVVERVYEYVPVPETTVPPTTQPAVTEPSTTVDTMITVDTTTTTVPVDPSTTTTTLAPTTTTTTTTTVPPAPLQVVDGSWTCAPRVTTWNPVATDCIVRGLGTLDTTPGAAPSGGTYLGYRVTVRAINGVGTAPASAPKQWIAALGTADAPADPVVPTRAVTARIPTPIVDLDLAGAATSRVSIPGYVSVPMGRISVKNLPGHDVRVNGGILTSTFDVTDGRAGPVDAARPASLPIGYLNDIVLQRTVRVSSTVGHTTVVATVQVNENGEFAVNSWVVD